jgi:hypothetical protein
MKTVLIDQDDIAPSSSLTQQVRSAAVSIAQFLVGRSTVTETSPYSSGYDSFYKGVDVNPYPENTVPYSEWARGRCAFNEDFDDRVA